MNGSTPAAYGLWSLVILNSLVFIAFAFSYVGFILILLGFLFQWPTLLTLAMFPVLVLMYVRLAHNEEADSECKFAQAWRDYAATTPRFIPKMSVPSQMRPG